MEYFISKFVLTNDLQQDDPTVTQRVGDMADSLYETVLANDHHVPFHIVYVMEIIIRTVFIERQLF